MGSHFFIQAIMWILKMYFLLAWYFIRLNWDIGANYQINCNESVTSEFWCLAVKICCFPPLPFWADEEKNCMRHFRLLLSRRCGILTHTYVHAEQKSWAAAKSERVSIASEQEVFLWGAQAETQQALRLKRRFSLLTAPRNERSADIRRAEPIIVDCSLS